MATTTNYAWETPDDTDLVKDGAAAIRTLGNSIDTTMFTMVPKTIVDAKGDLIAATAADTVSRLAVGANNSVLTADSSTATGLKWGTPAATGENWSLVGSAALTGAATITVTGISNANEILVAVEAASSANASSYITMRFNSDSAANYNAFQVDNTLGSTYSAAAFSSDPLTSGAEIYLGNMSTSTSSSLNGYLFLKGCNAAGLKAFHGAAGGKGAGSPGHGQRFYGGYYAGTSTISSVSLISSSGNFDAGTIYVYKTA